MCIRDVYTILIRALALTSQTDVFMSKPVFPQANCSDMKTCYQEKVSIIDGDVLYARKKGDYSAAFALQKYGYVGYVTSNAKPRGPSSCFPWLACRRCIDSDRWNRRRNGDRATSYPFRNITGAAAEQHVTAQLFLHF